MSRRIGRGLLLLLIFAVHPLLLHASPAQGDAELLHIRETVWRAWFTGNLTLLERLVPADTIVISAGDKEWKDQADVLKESREFHASGAKLDRLEFPKTVVQHFGNVAIVWSDYVLEVESGGKHSVSAGRATEVFVLRDGTWVNPGWHTDRVH